MLTQQFIINSFYIFFTSTIFIKITLLLLNIKNIRLHFKNTPKQYSDIITNEQHQKAQSYTIEKNKLSIISIIVQSLILITWLSTSLLNELIVFFETFSESNITNGVFILFSFSFINSVISFPISVYSTFCIEEKYGFNKTTPALFLQDLLKQFLVGIVIGLPFIFGILTIFYKLGNLWWLYSWCFIIVFQFVMIWAYPKFISPLFNKFHPLDDEELSKSIDKLSKKTNIFFKDYYVMNASLRSAHGNAYFTGFGKNKRIVFFDTLLETLNSNEVTSVLAHELGHLDRKHILKSILISSLFMFIGLFVLGQLSTNNDFFQAFNLKSNQKYTALLLFSIIIPYYTYLITPLASWFSRKNEYEADEFAATHASSKALKTALLKMYKDNSSTLTPHKLYAFFYYSHPAADERIHFLEKFKS